MVERVDMKLTAAVRTMKRSKRFPRQPLKPKPKVINRICTLKVTNRICTLKVTKRICTLKYFIVFSL